MLHSSLGEDLSVSKNGAFEFATKGVAGTAYAITVATQPTSPWQTCSVALGTGTIGSGDVTNVAVTCTTNRYAVGGTVNGLTGTGLVLHADFGGGEDLAVSSSSFTFAGRPESGSTFAVTVKTQPTSPAQTCVVTGGTGTIQGADVANVLVTCGTNTYGISGTVTGLTASGLVLHSSVNSEDLPVPSGATSFALVGRAPSGTQYEVTVTTHPTNLTCTVASGTGTMPAADVTNVAVTCSSVLQSWSAPKSWGGFWPDSPSMVQHAHFDANGIVIDKGPTFAMTGEPVPRPVGGFPAPIGTRYGGGPFPQEAVSYQAANAGALDIAGDMLVCAVVRPARSRPFDSYESPIIAKGVGDGTNTLPGGGWALMQMHGSWCFHYEYKDVNGDSHMFMSSTPAFFANQDFYRVLQPPEPLPDGVQPDPSFVVLCAGRNGDEIVIAANAWDGSSAAALRLDHEHYDQSIPSPFPGPYTLDAASAAPATIGGYYETSAVLAQQYPGTFGHEHVFEGLVYETAVWTEPATPENVREKLGVFQGLAAGSTYLRNRQASVVDATGALHTTWHHGPRIDPAKGYLFGLQSWNRVSYWIDGVDAYPYPMIYAAGQNLALWEPLSGGTVVRDSAVTVPGDSGNAAERVTLPGGASLVIDLDPLLTVSGPPPSQPHLHDRPTWDATGPIQGQLWIRPDSAGTLRVQKTDPAPGHGASCPELGASTMCEQKDVELGSLGAGQWNRVSLNGSFTVDATEDGSGLTLNRGKLVLTNPGTDPITFHAWGVQLTQLGGGGDLGDFDPGPLMYDWSASNDVQGLDAPWYTREVLILDAVTANTAPTGFCIGAEATMPSGLLWSAPFVNDRTAVAWVSHPFQPVTSVRLYVNGADGSADAGKLCVDVNGVTAACGALPGSFSDGNAHVVKACISDLGETRLFGDASATPLATGTVATMPNLATGRVLVGNGDARVGMPSTPWHGYVSRAFVCSDTGNAADCR